MTIIYGGVEENVILEGYVEYTETEQPPDQSGDIVVATFSTLTSTLKGVAEAVLEIGTPGKISVAGSVGGAAFCIIDITKSQEEEGLLQATITAVGATATGMHVGARIGILFGPQAAVAGAIVVGLVSGLVSFATGYLYDEVYDGIEDALSNAVDFISSTTLSVDENGKIDFEANLLNSTATTNDVKNLINVLELGGLSAGVIKVTTDLIDSSEIENFANELKAFSPTRVEVISAIGSYIEQVSSESIENYLIGTTENDTIIGNQNKDIIVGGTGDDYLAGGIGNDEYIFYSSDEGSDVINDSDGQGEIIVNGDTLTGGDYFDTNQYVSGNNVYEWDGIDGPDLAVKKAV